MALSMEEQRILAEIEDRLTRSEPALASRLSTLTRPSVMDVLRSPHARRVASLIALVALVAVSVAVYALISLRGIPQRAVTGRPTAAPGQPAVTVPSARTPARQAMTAHPDVPSKNAARLAR